MLQSHWKILTLLAAGLIASGIGAVEAWADSTQTPPPAQADGSYTVKVRGFCEGAGQASVTASSLTISVSVTDEEGRVGTLVVNNLTIDATNHFDGSGTVLGKSMTISGRLDPVESGETLLKTARLTATFATAEGRRGRVAGFVPITPGSAGSGGGSGASPGGPPPKNPAPPGGPSTPKPPPSGDSDRGHAPGRKDDRSRGD